VELETQYSDSEQKGKARYIEKKELTYRRKNIKQNYRKHQTKLSFGIILSLKFFS
jgi:hypothetical protein